MILPLALKLIFKKNKCEELLQKLKILLLELKIAGSNNYSSHLVEADKNFKPIIQLLLQKKI